MPAQYAVGQALPNGATVVSVDFVTAADGTTTEAMTDSAGNRTDITVPGANTPVANAAATDTALGQAMDRLTQIVNQGNTLAAQQTAWTLPQQRAVAQAIADLALIERRLIRKATDLFDAAN